MEHQILWRRLDAPGHEYAQLSAQDEGWILEGTAVFEQDGHPCVLTYRVLCDASWCTTSATVQGQMGPRPVDLTIATSAARQWTLNGASCPQVDGCTDIDLGFTPATNLLPIRRLKLSVGREASVEAAWLQFPALTVERLPQTYRRETESTVRYASRDGAFVRVLDVAPSGFVTQYPGFWTAEAMST